MKKSLRHTFYAAGGHYDYADRLYILKHGKYREKKSHYMTKKARLAVKNGKVDGINIRQLLEQPSKPCMLPKYYAQCEQAVADAIRDNNLTKELCEQFLLLSDCMFVRTEKVNTLARAAVRHRLAYMYLNEGDEQTALQLLENMIEELVKTTQHFGHQPDWDEYLINVSGELCDFFRAKDDTERVKLYSDVIEWAKAAAGTSSPD